MTDKKNGKGSARRGGKTAARKYEKGYEAVFGTPRPQDPGPKYQCPECKAVLQSMHRHDFVQCGCPNQAFVDGGSWYTRLGAKTFMPRPVKP